MNSQVLNYYCVCNLYTHTVTNNFYGFVDLCSHCLMIENWQIAELIIKLLPISSFVACKPS